MINGKTELEYYMKCDRIAIKRNDDRMRIIGDSIWKFLIALRKYEYYINCKPKSIFFYLAKIRYSMLVKKTGFHIPPNTCGPGLSLAHLGSIIINGNSRLGSNCRIQTGVTIGTTNGSNEAPKIGNNVFLGDGAKIIGKISVADNVAIGANAVVVNSITEKCTSWGGVPAKKISNKGSSSNVIPATELVRNIVRKYK